MFQGGTSMLYPPAYEGKSFDVPLMIFTLAGNSRSETVIRELRAKACAEDNPNRIHEHLAEKQFPVFGSQAQIAAVLSNGTSPERAVALFDQPLAGKHFTYATRLRSSDRPMPAWTSGSLWGVAVGEPCLMSPTRCANQIYADFVSNFSHRLNEGEFPWGKPRRTDTSPQRVALLGDMRALLERLNSGPNLARMVNRTTEDAFELPEGSRISWNRVLSEPFTFDGEYLSRLLFAQRHFEIVCDQVVRDLPDVAELLMAGVDMPDNEVLRKAYLHPSHNHFSVGRLDLHYTGTGLFASENDEMPGGLPELFHVDMAYGQNLESWQRFFHWLTARGKVLFVVSHDWSSCYVPEVEWFVGQISALGFDAELVLTDDLSDLSISDTDVSFRGSSVGTVWRQFPIFETQGKLADLVLAAQAGVVRMVPEFAHYGNKSWFSIFRSHNYYFRNTLSPEDFALLEEVLPDSCLILDQSSFPCSLSVGDESLYIKSLNDLRELPASVRDQLVLKICGANSQASRSYGVLMTNGLKQDKWVEWIDQRLALGQPFIVQHCLETGVLQVPVYNTKQQRAELMRARVLLRPWTYGEGEDLRILSVGTHAVPAVTRKVHGMVSMGFGVTRLR